MTAFPKTCASPAGAGPGPQRGPVAVDWAAEAARHGRQRHDPASRPEATAGLQTAGRTLQSVRTSLGVARSPIGPAGSLALLLPSQLCGQGEARRGILGTPAEDLTGRLAVPAVGRKGKLGVLALPPADIQVARRVRPEDTARKLHMLAHAARSHTLTARSQVADHSRNAAVPRTLFQGADHREWVVASGSAPQ